MARKIAGNEYPLKPVEACLRRLNDIREGNVLPYNPKVPFMPGKAAVSNPDEIRKTADYKKCMNSLFKMDVSLNGIPLERKTVSGGLTTPVLGYPK